MLGMPSLNVLSSAYFVAPDFRVKPTKEPGIIKRFFYKCIGRDLPMRVTATKAQLEEVLETSRPNARLSLPEVLKKHRLLPTAVAPLEFDAKNRILDRIMYKSGDILQISSDRPIMDLELAFLEQEGPLLAHAVVRGELDVARNLIQLGAPINEGYGFRGEISLNRLAQICGYYEFARSV